MQNNYAFDLTLLWEKTNYGLEYWYEVFPDCHSLENKNKHFKTHNEVTASTTLSNRKNKDGVYRIYNHATSEGFSVIDHVCKERSCEFIDAVKWLFEKYGLSSSNQFFKPETNFSDETKKEVGYWKVEPLKAVKDFSFVAPFASKTVLDYYNLVQLKSYERVFLNKKTNKNTLIKVVATDSYPIFAYKNNDFAKLYEPVAPKGDKYLLKHSHLGTKPARHIYGWDRLFEEVDEEELIYLHDKLKDATDDKEIKALRSEIEEKQLKEVFICTGGSDGINLASLGYKVIWFNSEADLMNIKEYNRLSHIARGIYYIPDLDETGVKQAVKLGLQFIKIKILWLPQSLKEVKKKDLADWVRMQKGKELSHVKNKFEQLKTLAIEFKFWDSDGKTVRINPKKALNFLYYNHFRLFKQPFKNNETGKEDDGYFLQVENNIIKKTSPTDIRRFVAQWLDDNYYSINIYNTVIKSNFFNQQILKALPYFEYKKTSCGLNHQYYFFNNKPVLVTPEKIEVQEYSEKLPVTVWEENVVNHIFYKTENYFETSIDEQGRNRIKINDNSSNFLKVLINTSRVFWRKDCDNVQQDLNRFSIASDNLTDDEKQLQENHLLNKIYAIGYLLHQYKVASKSYMVLGMDYQQGKTIKGSYGGTGKSFLIKALALLLNVKTVEANNLKKDAFPMDGVTPKTQLVNFDDIGMYQNYRDFYTMVTDNLVANQKGGVKYDIPFKDSAKIAGTTNFSPSEVDGSSMRRIYNYYNTDYYHQATPNDDYAFTRKISDDFNKKDLFGDDYSEKDFNHDYNFMLQCLQFYLGCAEEIKAPSDVLIERSLWQKIGDELKKFFDKFFEEPEYLNNWFEKSSLSRIYMEEYGGKKTKQQINEALENYCIAKKWSLEEKKRKVVTGNSVAHYFVNPVHNALPQEPENQLPTKDIQTDLPF